MTTFQIILVVVGGLIVLYFLIAFFLPATKTLYRSTIIDKSAKNIFPLITDFNYYRQWNPWSEKEPEAKGEMSGEPGKIGHKWNWEGKKIGAGYLQIKKLEEGKFVRSDLIFTAPRKMTSEDLWKFEEIEKNRTKVTWEHFTELGYPTERYFGLMLEKILGPDFEKGLKNLKKLSETSKSQ